MIVESSYIVLAIEKFLCFFNFLTKKDKEKRKWIFYFKKKHFEIGFPPIKELAFLRIKELNEKEQGGVH